MKQRKTEQDAITNQMMSSFAVPAAIVVAGILIASAIIFSGNGNPVADNSGQGIVQDGSNQKELLALVEIKSDDWVLGNRKADIYIVEFSDTECPFCKRFHETMNQIIEEYDGEVAWVYRHFPLASLHKKAPKEAEALECAGELGGNDGFWAYTNRLYEITPSNDGLDAAQLPEIAEDVGLDVGAFEECLNSGKYAEEVAKDLQNAIDTGGRGTPHSIIVAGDTLTLIQGAQPFSAVKATIDNILNQ